MFQQFVFLAVLTALAPPQIHALATLDSLELPVMSQSVCLDAGRGPVMASLIHAPAIQDGKA